MITLKFGSITDEEVDAVVNAANQALLGGGGVDGAIHRAAGPGLLAECKQLRASTLPGGLGVGEAVATGAYDLAARWVIHTVGPQYAHTQDPTWLEAAYRSSLSLAQELGARSVALPAISAGVYGWPLGEVARVALRVAGEFPALDLTFALWPESVFEEFEAAASKAWGEPSVRAEQELRYQLGA